MAKSTYFVRFRVEMAVRTDRQALEAEESSAICGIRNTTGTEPGKNDKNPFVSSINIVFRTHTVRCVRTHTWHE